VDIWFLHAKDHAEDLTSDLMEAQRIAVQSGKARFKGVSTHFSGMLPHIARTGQFDVAMVTYNFKSPPEAPKRVEAAAKAGLGLVAMKVMGGTNRSITHLFRRERATSAALKWALRDPRITCAVPSMTDFDQLDENLRSAGAAFTEEDRKVLAFGSGCRSCGTCVDACERGLPVAAVLRSLMYAESYGQFAVGRESYQQAAPARCDCAVCTVRCPHGVRVAERMARAEELFG
jgi:predicted aldo/keto reductase-like oxidoreductase